jgi:hypothetical protein
VLSKAHDRCSKAKPSSGKLAGVSLVALASTFCRTLSVSGPIAQKPSRPYCHRQPQDEVRHRMHDTRPKAACCGEYDLGAPYDLGRRVATNAKDRAKAFAGVLCAVREKPFRGGQINSPAIATSSKLRRKSSSRRHFHGRTLQKLVCARPTWIGA